MTIPIVRLSLVVAASITFASHASACACFDPLAVQADPTEDADESESQAAEAEASASGFQRENRELRYAHVPEVKVLTGRWYGEPRFVDPGMGLGTAKLGYLDRVVGRTVGFSQAVAVLPAATRRDGTRMPPTCVFSLPHDGRGSLWFLTPEGLDEQCYSADDLESGARRLGTALELGPDYDGDGIPELIVTALAASGDDGWVYLFSVAERQVVLALQIAGQPGDFGVAACVVPDLDADGREDFAVLHGLPTPRVVVYSTKDGEALREVPLAARPGSNRWRPDHRLRLIPQVDAQSGPLLMVSIPSTRVDELVVIDLVTGEQKWSVVCSDTESGYGHWCKYSSAFPTEDLDGDGIAELLVAGRRDHDRDGTDWAGYAVFSGATGVELRAVDRIPYHSGGDGEVYVTDYPDLDGDGFREHIVASTTVFSRDLVLFSGRTGEPLYQIDFDELPYEYSNDIQAHVDWDEDGKNDLVLHDTDVWEQSMEPQLIVLSMAGHEILHYLRPQDLEYAIAVREGWTDASRPGVPATQHWEHASTSHIEPLVMTIDPDAGSAIRVSDVCESPSEPASAIDESVATEQDCGTALAVIPSATLPDGTLSPTWIAVGLPSLGLGSVCLLQPNHADSSRVVTLEDIENVHRFGEEILVCADLDGDGVRDLIVKARYEDRESRRLFAVSSMDATILFELDSVSSNAAQRNACCVIPDRDGDGIDDIAVLAVRSGWQFGNELQDCVLFHPASPNQWGITLLSLKQQYAASYGRPVHLRDAARTHGQIVLLTGEHLLAFDLTTERPTWSRQAEAGPGAIFLDAIALEDVDGDGVEELLVAVSTGLHSEGRVELRSGNTGDVVRTSVGAELYFGGYGTLVNSYVDLDNDGVRELLVTNGALAGSSVLVLNGRDGSLMHKLVGSFAWGDGRFIDGSVDWDGKGLPDLVVGAWSKTDQWSAAAVTIVSMEDHCVWREFGAQEWNAILARRTETEAAIAATKLVLGEVSIEETECPAFSASETCDAPVEPEGETRKSDGAVEDDQSDDRVERLHSNAAESIGRSLAAVPGYRDASGVDRPAFLVFGVPDDRRGSIWFQSAEETEPERVELPADRKSLRRFGKALVSAGDLDGDGARDLIVGAETKGANDTRFFAFSSAKRTLIHELDARSSLATAVPTTIPDVDGDDVLDFAFVTDQRAVEGKPDFVRLRVQLVSGKTGKALWSIVLETLEIEPEWLRLAVIPGTGEHPAQMLIAGYEIIAFGLESGERTWARDAELPPYFWIMDICSTADLDGDGVPEVLACNAKNRGDGELLLLSGRTGEELRSSAPFLQSCNLYGFEMCDYIDVDGDGFRDALCTLDALLSPDIGVFSGRTGLPLQQFYTPAETNIRYLDATVDYDGKGLPDLVIGTQAELGQVPNSGVYIVSMEEHCAVRTIEAQDVAGWLVRER